MPHTLCRAGLAAAAAVLLCGWASGARASPGVDVPILEYHRVGPEPVVGMGELGVVAGHISG